jgi:hypothetical protein
MIILMTRKELKLHWISAALTTLVIYKSDRFTPAM